MAEREDSSWEAEVASFSNFRKGGLGDVTTVTVGEKGV